MTARLRARLRFGDLLSESLAGLFARPGRSVLTALGAVLGIGSLVATLGVAETAGNQIVAAFDELAAASVVVTAEQGFMGERAPQVRLPWDSEQRLTRLNGVAAAGTMAEVVIGDALASSVPIKDPAGLTEFPDADDRRVARSLPGSAGRPLYRALARPGPLGSGRPGRCAWHRRSPTPST